jgi:hypothetical protein
MIVRLRLGFEKPFYVMGVGGKDIPLLPVCLCQNKHLCEFHHLGCTIPCQGDLWPATCKLHAATVDKNLPSALPISSFFKSEDTRPRNVASLAVWQRRTSRGDPATVRLLHREHPSYVRDADSQQPYRLSRAAIDPSIAATVTRHARDRAADRGHVPNPRTEFEQIHSSDRNPKPTNR